MMRRYCATILLFAALSLYAQNYPGLRVQGRYLYDRRGERILLRGANAMIVFWDREGKVNYPELAKTGANCCRIFWRTGHDPEPVMPASDLDKTLQNCIDNKMIPMVSVWDATGDWSQLQKCVDYWRRTDVTAVIKKHEKYMILNIANEAGGSAVGQTEFRDKYTKAVNQLRNAGIHVPLVIDADGWGRNGDALLDNGIYLLEQDPDHNLIFSWHLWDPTNWGNGSKASIRKFIDGSIERDICLIVGEFGPIEFGDNPSSGKINWEYLIEYAAEKEIGWLAWVWNWTDYHSIVNRSSGKYGDWANSPWGEQLAVDSPYSIQKTSVRPEWLETGIMSSVAIPDIFSLQQNYPNPFNPATTILFSIPTNGFVQVAVFNQLGERVSLLLSQNLPAGEHKILWNAEEFPSGVYIYQVQWENFVQNKKCLLMK